MEKAIKIPLHRVLGTGRLPVKGRVWHLPKSLLPARAHGGTRLLFQLVVVVAGLASMVAPSRSEAETKPRPADPICAELLALEEQTNPTLPRPIDEATELVQVRVNCETRTVSYTKRLLLDPASLADGWQVRKQRQYVQLHCNAQGLASASGWNAMDIFFGPEYNYLITLHATPQDCANTSEAEKNK